MLRFCSAETIPSSGPEMGRARFRVPRLRGGRLSVPPWRRWCQTKPIGEGVGRGRPTCEERNYAERSQMAGRHERSRPCHAGGRGPIVQTKPIGGCLPGLVRTTDPSAPGSPTCPDWLRLTSPAWRSRWTVPIGFVCRDALPRGGAEGPGGNRAKRSQWAGKDSAIGRVWPFVRAGTGPFDVSRPGQGGRRDPFGVPPSGGTPNGKTVRTPTIQAAIAVMRPAIGQGFFFLSSSPAGGYTGDFPSNFTFWFGADRS